MHEKAGCQLFYLPPYSPDLNPIEHHWHNIKTAIRKIMRDVEITLQDAMETTLKNMSIAFIVGSAIQLLGGWSSFSIVLRYAHLSSSHLHAAAKRIYVTNSLQAGV